MVNISGSNKKILFPVMQHTLKIPSNANNFFAFQTLHISATVYFTYGSENLMTAT